MINMRLSVSQEMGFETSDLRFEITEPNFTALLAVSALARLDGFLVVWRWPLALARD